MSEYIVATVKPWNLSAFERYTPELNGEWHLISSPDELSLEYLSDIKPRYVFFPHWSWRVPEEITSRFECVAFHMTDLPYGRGGSPLQNLLINGVENTKLSAFRMVPEFDAGPIYKKEALSLEGKAQKVYERVANLVYQIIRYMVQNEPEAVHQEGTPSFFNQRTPDQSRLPETNSLIKIYDHIRMLDAEGYPHAFLEYGGLRLEFTQADLLGDEVQVLVKIIPKP